MVVLAVSVLLSLDVSFAAGFSSGSSTTPGSSRVSLNLTDSFAVRVRLLEAAVILTSPTTSYSFPDSIVALASKRLRSMLRE